MSQTYIVISYDTDFPTKEGYFSRFGTIPKPMKSDREAWEYVASEECPEELFWKFICPSSPLLTIRENLPYDEGDWGEISYDSQSELCREILQEGRRLYRDNPERLRRDLHQHKGDLRSVTICPLSPFYTDLKEV